MNKKEIDEVLKNAYQGDLQEFLIKEMPDLLSQQQRYLVTEAKNLIIEYALSNLSISVEELIKEIVENEDIKIGGNYESKNN